ncbi:TetR/AcrR family transcriptional regulator [Flavisolibacter ginsenosidimutans]|uniref:TetR/AcrR family transcriptional regulator n=1 Tax=Flavisolibacter ginsenosidimutans TaxID=661481 RepID=UPI00155A976E|nr:TetR/AcrR family transcriptional regulator [Flavisolibacter ginsenosidimutans]
MRTKDESKIAAIYKATLSLVKERGLAGITMSDISREASIATGTLYIYFKNKDELIKALFCECREKSAKEYFAGVEATESFEEKMRTVFINIVRYKMTHFDVSAFLEQSYHSPFVCITDLKKKQKALNPLFALIEEGIEKKKIKNVAPDLVLSYLFGIVNEMVKKAYFSNKKLSSETTGQLYAMFRDGIR